MQRGRKRRIECLAKQLEGLSKVKLEAVDKAVEILAQVLLKRQ
jgi:hypothetical protein